MLSRFKQYDLYRRIPKDLTETSALGAVLSLCAVVFMVVLFAAELWAFLYSPVSTNVILDPNNDQSLRINFNITLLAIPCDFASIEVVDVLGTRRQDFVFGSYVNKWTVDSSGIMSVDRGFSHEQADLEHDEHNLQQLHLNGVHVLSLDESNFNRWIGDHTYTFINFHSPWCSWCKLLEPVWEAFAERVVLDTIPVSVVQVDCIRNRVVCEEQKIQAFPTLRMFKEGVVQSPDYTSDRTVDAFVEFAKSRLAKDEALSHLLPHEQIEHQEKEKVDNQHHQHPGCMLIGSILVNRVPGNFHIQMKSKFQNIFPPMANLSHVVNSLSFGTPYTAGRTRSILSAIPDNLVSESNIYPLDETAFVNRQLHQAHHHYIKVVSTHVELSNKYLGSDASLLYQMVQSSQNMMYEETEIPEARFSYDISPMAVVITRKDKHWYEFITSMCALIGGTFTVVGLISGFLNVIFKTKKA